MSAGQDVKKWMVHTAHVRERHGLPPFSSPWTGREGVELKGLPDAQMERRKDLLNVGFSIRRDSFSENTPTSEIIESFWANVNEGVQRRPFTDRPGTFCKTSVPYSYQHDRCLSGYSMMRLLGFEKFVVSPGAITDFKVRGLAGEGVSLPDAGSVLFHIWANPLAPWWQTDD